MTDGSPEPPQGQWAQPPPSDFIALVAQITAIGVDVRHLGEDQREQRRSFDQFIVEHRSQHLEDRTNSRQERKDIQQGIADSVKSQLDEVKAGRKVWIGLAATGIGAVIVDILLRIVNQ